MSTTDTLTARASNIPPLHIKRLIGNNSHDLAGRARLSGRRNHCRCYGTVSVVRVVFRATIAGEWVNREHGEEKSVQMQQRPDAVNMHGQKLNSCHNNLSAGDLNMGNPGYKAGELHTLP